MSELFPPHGGDGFCLGTCCSAAGLTEAKRQSPTSQASPGLASGAAAMLCLVSTAEHACYDPKDSELCLARAKPQETGVEARSRCDVQIHGIS